MPANNSRAVSRVQEAERLRDIRDRLVSQRNAMRPDETSMSLGVALIPTLDVILEKVAKK